MKIAVIGAGIVGLSTASALVQDGHEVILFERNASVAQEASFACAGQLSTSLSHPWAFPELRQAAWISRLIRPSGISFGKALSVADLRWLYRWKTATLARPDALAMAHALVAYSLQHLHAWVVQDSWALEQSQGHTLLWKSEADFTAFQIQVAALKACGVPFKNLTPDEARAMEPALDAHHHFHSATYFADDAVGNCRQFGHFLKEKLSRAGVQMRFDEAVQGIASQGGVQLQTSRGKNESVEHVVVCAGGGAAALGLGLQALPLTTVWSYSLSAAIREPLNAPRSVVQDMGCRVSVSRMGERVRVSGGAELGAARKGDNAAVVKRLYKTLNSLFPGAVDFKRNTQIWRGASQFTSDGLPLLGPGTAPGIWLNLGHGHNGWSMACGSAKVMADLIAGRKPDLDITPLNPRRFHV